MKILILGANGFIGSSVTKVLKNHHNILATAKNASAPIKEINLLDSHKVISVIKDFTPDVIVNCAGVVDNGPGAKLNVDFTRNLLESVKSLGINPKIIICGSASVYGIVKKEDLPISENYQLNPVGDYANAKKQEEDFALKFAKENNLDLIVIRIFNPIGKNMKGRFLVTNIINQISDIKNNLSDNIEVRRKDSLRDYLDVRDVALAINYICEKPARHSIYNVGSGVSISNEDLARGLLAFSNLDGNSVEIVETESEPESLFAAQADISRIKSDFGWQPEYKLAETLKEIAQWK